MAEIILITRTRILKKRGSALLLTVLTLAFLLVLLGGFNFDRQLRYWVSNNRRDELVSFYNAQSAYDQAESDLVEHYTTSGFIENSKKSFLLNGGICRYQWTVKNTELKLQGFGIYKKSYSLLQGSFLCYLTKQEYPLLLVSETVKSTGELLFSLNAIDKGIFLPVSRVPLRLTNGFLLHHLVHYNQGQTNNPLLSQEIAAFALLSESYPEHQVEEYILSLISSPFVTASELSLNHIYFSKSDVCLDLRQAGELVELPSLICCQAIQILSRPEQTIFCRGLLYANSLNISEGTLTLEPMPEFYTYMSRHSELLMPKNFQPSPQMVLARKDFRFLPERVMGE